jgi:hypothetical protein
LGGGDLQGGGGAVGLGGGHVGQEHKCCLGGGGSGGGDRLEGGDGLGKSASSNSPIASQGAIQPANHRECRTRDSSQQYCRLRTGSTAHGYEISRSAHRCSDLGAADSLQRSSACNRAACAPRLGEVGGHASDRQPNSTYALHLWGASESPTSRRPAPALSAETSLPVEPPTP